MRGLVQMKVALSIVLEQSQDGCAHWQPCCCHKGRHTTLLVLRLLLWLLWWLVLWLLWWVLLRLLLRRVLLRA